MGSSDRTYMRDRALPAGWSARGVATWLAGIAVAAFLAFHIARGQAKFDLDARILASLRALDAGAWWTLVTSAWAPSRSMDAAFTMFAFWFFGRLVERDVGGGRLVSLVLLATVLPAAVFLGVCRVTETDDVSRGLCGAVAAFAVHAAVREPHEVAGILGLLVRVRVLALIYGLIVLGGFVGFPARADARPAVEIAGALLGAAAARFSFLPDLGALRLPGRRRGATGANGEDDLRRRVDALLDKVARDGIGSLSPSERAFLEEASKRYR